MSSDSDHPKSGRKKNRKPVLPIRKMSLATNQILKPEELVDFRISGKEEMTKGDWLIFNRLLRNAHGPDMHDANKFHTIAMSELRGAGHQANDRVKSSLRRLMVTVLEYRNKTTGQWAEVQLLGWNDGNDRASKGGMLRYKIDPSICQIYGEAFVYASLDLEVQSAFSSQYSFALYESIALRINMNFKSSDVFDMETLRGPILGVPSGKLGRYSHFKDRALMTAINEVNDITPFQVEFVEHKKGRSVHAVELFWRRKTDDENKVAYKELQRRLPRQKELFPEIDLLES